jgi:hypothetical protein
MPRLPQKRRDQAPPASTTLSQAIVPFSVTTPETLPAETSRARAPRSAERSGAVRAGGIGDGRRGLLRLGATVGRRVEGAAPFDACARHQLAGVCARHEAGIELIGPGVLQPALAARDLLVGLAQIGNAALAKAGLGADPLVHAAPQAQRLDGERDLARVPAHLAAPAPVAARLLGAHSPFSHSTTSMPRSASSSAVQAPMMPPPMTTTPARSGKSLVADDGIGSWCHA